MIVRRTGFETNQFIKKNTTIEEFYNFITYNGTNFEFDINDQDETYHSVFQDVCEKGNISLAQALISIGANLNTFDNLIKVNPFAQAAFNGNLNMVKLFLNNGVKLINDTYKHQAIGLAISNNQTEIKNYLIEKDSETLLELLSNQLKYYSDFKQNCIDAFENAQAKNGNKASYKDILASDIIDLINTEMPFVKIANLLEKISDIEAKILELIKEDNIKENNNLKKLKSYLEVYKGWFNLSRNLSFMHEAAVVKGNLEIVKLLVKNGAHVFGKNKVDGVENPSIPAQARNAGHNEVAAYLEGVQKSRYERLQLEANREKKHTLFVCGMFFDNNSVLNKNITQNADNKTTTDITRSILKKM